MVDPCRLGPHDGRVMAPRQIHVMGFGIHQVRLCGQQRQQGLEVGMRACIQARLQPATGHAQPRPPGHPAVRQAASGQHLMQQRSILHAPRQRAGMVAGPGQRQGPCQRDATHRGLEAHHATEGRRNADGAPRVAADGRAAQPHRHGHTRAAGRAARLPGRIMRIADIPGPGVLARGPQRDLVHVGLGKDQCTGGLQPLHHCTGCRRYQRQCRLGTRLHGCAFQLEQILHADPGTQQRPLRGTVGLPSNPVGQRLCLTADTIPVHPGQRPQRCCLGCPRLQKGQFVGQRTLSGLQRIGLLPQRHARSPRVF